MTDKDEEFKFMGSWFSRNRWYVTHSDKVDDEGWPQTDVYNKDGILWLPSQFPLQGKYPIEDELARKNFIQMECLITQGYIPDNLIEKSSLKLFPLGYR